MTWQREREIPLRTRSLQTGEVRVIVHALADLDTSRRVDVARQESVDVVLNVNCKRQLELKVKFNVQQLHGGP